MLEVKVCRQLAQRRSHDEAKENVEYLANLPRSIGFKLYSLEADEPVEQGLLWYYRGIIRYVPKERVELQRLERDRNIILARIRRACVHKRWGRSPWHIEGETSTNGSAMPADRSAQPIHDEMRDEDEALAPTNALADPAYTASGPVREETQNGDELAQFSAVSDVQRPDPAPNLPSDDTIKEVAAKFAMMRDPSRLKIMLVLAQQERNVTELCADLGAQTQPAVSHHLSDLRHSRLADTRRDGKHTYYHLTDEGRQLAEIVEQLVGR